MTLLQRKHIRQGEEGPEFDCIYCGAENVLDYDPDDLVDTRCWSCQKLQTINHEFPRRAWTRKELWYLRKHFPGRRTAVVAFELQRSVSGTQQKAVKLGLRKTEAFMASDESGIIRKGAKPWNKGLSYVPGGRCSAGWFKKGHLPHNTLHDGAVTLRKDSGSGKMYPHIRLGLGKWKMLHVHIWEQENGPVPPGKIITFKDGDTMNPELGNLELITRAENMNRNTIHRFPAELKEQIRLVRKLERKLKNHAKK